MGVIQIILAAIVTIGVLVTIHEYGHFWVARRCGVKVLRFSVGFGKALYKWYDRHGTEFVIAAIPLGGYVKMLDEREGDVAPEEVQYAFNRQPVGKRIAVVVAGPAANFLFAIVAYWLMYVIGITTVVPVIGAVESGSIAARAGVEVNHEIVAVDNEETATWQAINIQMLGRIGDSGAVILRTRSIDNSLEREYQLQVKDWLAGVEQPDPIGSLGIEPYRPMIPARIGQILEQGAGERAGLKAQDKVLSVAGEPVAQWEDLVQQVKANPQRPIDMEIEREGRVLTLTVTPDAKVTEDNKVVGYLGVGAEPVPWPAELQRTISYSIFGAWVPAVKKTWDMSVLTLVSLKKMLVGLISIKNLSGPITIAKVAGDSIDRGVETFLNFLAYLSISLGLINILPIPVLDGGHLMYYLVELVRGRPVSEKVQMLGLRIGISIILALMMLALYNDLTRL